MNRNSLQRSRMGLALVANGAAEKVCGMTEDGEDTAVHVPWPAGVAAMTE